ncbi:similar to Saccharomyces cerevisiae YHR182W Putative protein of unknown function [Maudiozyma saulgeensis]|uniref:Uncharacterized protein n=1 Tax=Maudiozyma saulgeensis TaxID=1789683 RepID=A0A1X7RAM3_9SACH|nr:similar to Saccharomyces cerevisiae YHR182W Putative protein of unknown function [Kazachstania saulgeensis]
METKYWTRDYISGIRLFIHDIKEETKLIEEEIKKIHKFNEQCWKPFMRNVKALQNMNGFYTSLNFSLPSEQIDSMVNRSSILVQLLKENQQFCQDYEKEITPIYDQYYDNLIKLRQLNSGNTGKATSSVSNSDDSNIRYPFQLDSEISINNEQEMNKYIKMLQLKIPIQKTIFGKEYFKGNELITALRGEYPLIDTSQYNMNRLGQMLLDMNIIEEYSARTLYLTRTQIMYDMERSYNWVATEPASVYTNKDVAESLQLIEQYVLVEANKVNLEIIHCRNCRYYKTMMNSRIERTLRDIDNKFYAKISKIFTKFDKDEVSFQIINHGYSYYSRDNGIPLSFEEEKPFMFGCTSINGDIYDSIRLLLEQCKDETDIWYGDIDIKRISTIKIKILNNFTQETLKYSNALSIEAIVKESENTTKYINRDWADLVKLWLYELPGGIIIRDKFQKKLIVPQIYCSIFTLFVKCWLPIFRQDQDSKDTTNRHDDRIQLIQAMIRDSPGGHETIDTLKIEIYELMSRWDTVTNQPGHDGKAVDGTEEDEFVPLPFRTTRQQQQQQQQQGE